MSADRVVIACLASGIVAEVAVAGVVAVGAGADNNGTLMGLKIIVVGVEIAANADAVVVVVENIVE